MAETVEQKTVLNIDTSGSVKSVKELKQQIKDLKDKIVELTSAGEDASEEYTQLGTSMRQLKEINEQAMRSSKDLGDQLKVVSGSVKGVAGAISAVSGVMGLMGVESEKSTKLLKTMASAMSITTGIQAMESGYKAVKHLASGFITAAKGAKTLGGAIKAAFMSNPIGIIITALTTLAAVIGTVISRAKEMEDALKEAARNSAEAIEEVWKAMLGSFKSDTQTWAEYISSVLESQVVAMGKQADKAKDFAEATLYPDKDGKLAQAGIDHFMEVMDAETAVFTGKTKQYLQEARDLRGHYYQLYGKDIEKYTEEELKQFQSVWGKEMLAYQNLAYERNLENEAYLQILSRMSKEDERYADVLRKQEQARRDLVEALGQYNSVVQEQETTEKAIQERNKKAAEDAKRKREEAYKKAKENAKKQLALDKKYYDDMYAAQKANAQRQLEFQQGQWDLKLRKGEVSQEEYNREMLQLELDYYTVSEAYLKAYVENIAKLQQKASQNKLLDKADVDAIYTMVDYEEYGRQIEEFTRLRNDLIHEFNQGVLESDAAKKELENTIAIQEQINQIERESFEKRLALEQEYIENKNKLHYTQYELELQLLGEEREHENALYEAFVQENEQKMALLKEQYANRLIDEQTFNESRNELNQEMFERELEHEKKMVDIKRDEVDQKKQLQEMYVKFEQSMMSSVSSIFTGLADLLGDSNEDYKGLRIAATLLDTLQGSIAAYTGMVSSIPGPLGIAAGIAAATGVITSGMATISKMNEVDAKNGTTSTSALATQTFTTPQTATIATGMSNDYSDMMGNAVQEGTQNQRVYVVYSDIEQAGGRRTQVVNSNTF